MDRSHLHQNVGESNGLMWFGSYPFNCPKEQPRRASVRERRRRRGPRWRCVRFLPHIFPLSKRKPTWRQWRSVGLRLDERLESGDVHCFSGSAAAIGGRVGGLNDIVDGRRAADDAIRADVAADEFF